MYVRIHENRSIY